MNEIDDSVLDAINQIRTRPDVNMPPVTAGLSQQEMRDLIRNERMVELAFEGHRLFDCRRWRIAEEVFPGREHSLRVGDKIVFTAVSYEFDETAGELVNYFGKQEIVWKEN